jgi:hypothetical protein
MSESLPIPDLFIRPLHPDLSEGHTRMTALRDDDHLLRRFGLAEVVRLCPTQELHLRLRSVADEVWALIEGAAEFHWQDRRPDSHAHGASHLLRAQQPHLVLAPAGVAFGVRALDQPALLLRLATHADNDPSSADDRTVPMEPET